MLRTKFYGIAIVSLICFLLVVFNYKSSSPIERAISFQSLQLDNDFSGETRKEEESIFVPEPSMEEIIKMQQRRIKTEMQDYQLPGEKSLEQLTLATGGQPIRNIILTTWRSGSTFLGDVINALRGNFYHYEPLLHYGIVQIRGPPHSNEALRVLKDLLVCNYSNLQDYLEYGMSHNNLFSHNERLWTLCGPYCWNSTFLNQFCSLFPFHSMKVLRIRLKLGEELLQDEKLNVKLIYMVRDPRGTLQSRKHRDWCPGEPDCDQPSVLCADMVSDYSAAIKLKELYPHRVKIIRYEDLSLDPHNGSKRLFNFMGLNMAPEVTDFINTHTTINLGGVSSTYRDSKGAPFHWKTDLNYSEIQFIQYKCREAMKLWGYVMATQSDLKDFNPLGPYEVARKR